MSRFKPSTYLVNWSSALSIVPTKYAHHAPAYWPYTFIQLVGGKRWSLSLCLPKEPQRGRPIQSEPTFTLEQLIDAAAQESADYRIGEEERERPHMAGMSALITALTLGDRDFTDVQTEIYAEIDRRAVAKGAPYPLM